MIDFLRANTWCTREEYIWGMTIPQIRLSNFDFSHVEYLKDKKDKKNDNAVEINDVDDLKNLTDLGLPIL